MRDAWFDNDKRIDITSLDFDGFSSGLRYMAEGKLIGAMKAYAGVMIGLPIRYVPPVKPYLLYYGSVHYKGTTTVGGFCNSVEVNSHQYGVGMEVPVLRLAKYPLLPLGSFNVGDVSLYIHYFDPDWTDINNDLFDENDPVYADDVLPGLGDEYPYELIVGFRVSFSLR